MRVAGQTFRPVQPPHLPPVLGVVVDEHVLADAEEGGGVHHQGGAHGHLEPPHVPRVPRVLQTVLVAFQEKLQKEPGLIGNLNLNKTQNNANENL